MECLKKVAFLPRGDRINSNQPSNFRMIRDRSRNFDHTSDQIFQMIWVNIEAGGTHFHQL